MNRISKQQVADAVIKNQIPLRKGQFLAISGDQIVKACALCQIALASGTDQRELMSKNDSCLTEQFLVECMPHLTPSYIHHFMYGFDGVGMTIDGVPIRGLATEDPARIAYEDGILASTLLGEMK